MKYVKMYREWIKGEKHMKRMKQLLALGLCIAMVGQTMDVQAFESGQEVYVTEVLTDVSVGLPAQTAEELSESGRHRADRGSSHKDDFSHISFLLVKTSAKVRLSCTQAKQIVQ